MPPLLEWLSTPLFQIRMRRCAASIVRLYKSIFLWTISILLLLPAYTAVSTLCQAARLFAREFLLAVLFVQTPLWAEQEMWQSFSGPQMTGACIQTKAFSPQFSATETTCLFPELTLVLWASKNLLARQPAF